MNSEYSGWPRWAKALLWLWGIAAVVVLVLFLHGKAVDAGKTESTSEVASRTHPGDRDPGKEAKLKAEKRELEKKVDEKQRPPVSVGPSPTEEALSSRKPHAAESAVSSDAESTFADLAASVQGRIGVAVAPFGSDPPTTYGGEALEVEHAWSSFKVPIVATLMRQGTLSNEEMEQARAAITASDNEAAAALFADLGSPRAAAKAVESTLRDSDYPTHVETAPPPPGAVSSWGQTEWTLANSAGFYRALACGQIGLDSSDTDEIIGLMSEVVSEQQWGLGSAGAAIPGAAIKAGWGPNGSESGPYLVRQSGILRDGRSGVAVTIAAEADSGSFEGGVQVLDQVAEWVRDHVDLNAGTC
jgi:hypothetical protein